MHLYKLCRKFFHHVCMMRLVLKAHLAAKVDAACPSVVVIVAFIVHKAAVPDDLPVQAKDVDGQIIAATAITPTPVKETL